jgi:hypothetical protein
VSRIWRIHDERLGDLARRGDEAQAASAAPDLPAPQGPSQAPASERKERRLETFAAVVPLTSLTYDTPF